MVPSMPKRDPAKTALNKRIAEMTAELETARPEVMRLLHEPTVQALHGRIGGKNAEFIDIKNEVILSPEAYVATWIRGLLSVLEGRRPLAVGDTYYDLVLAMQKHQVVRDYVVTFL